ncbi:MAG: hypothetical protein P4L84_06205 [Isosphaeraceae bacterium]|nr:hypothetical protein [Isosphaeraceae bacterium]
MTLVRSRLTAAAVLAAGVAIGWGLASVRPHALHAQGGDRSGESVLTSGPVLVRFNDGLKVQIPQDALYYLDYKGGRLVATVPSYRPTGAAPKYLGTFVERDLVTDFKLDLDAGQRPHFLMTTGSLGMYSDGWAPLFVFETTTNQVALYRVQQQTIGTVSKPQFELLELRTIDSNTAAPAAP